MQVKFKKLDGAAQLPVYSTDGAAGADVRSTIYTVIPPKSWQLVNTGLGCEVPEGFEIQARPRSGLAFRHGVTVLNSPGTIDSDYRGELCVNLYNASKVAFEINKGDRIAQIVVAPVIQGQFSWTEELSESARGAGGFGSTGVK